MGILRTALACALAFAALPVAIPSFAQPADASCIVAGRIANGRWAPRMAGVQLLAQDGKAVASPDKQALTGVRQVRLTRPALLSRCDGDRELALGDDAPATKSPVPAASAGLLPVESVGYPKLRTGGELVELKLTVPTERVVTLTR